MRMRERLYEGYKAHFGVQKYPKILKVFKKKDKRRCFASGSARKPPFFLFSR
jgi:hypothetical protein